MPFQELFYSRRRGLQIIHFPTLKIYRDLQHEAALPMREMNQLPLIFFLSMMKSHSALFVLKLGFEKKRVRFAGKKKEISGLPFLKLFTLAGILIPAISCFLSQNHPSKLPVSSFDPKKLARII